MADIFVLKNLAQTTTLFSVDDSGNVTAAGTISTTGTDDFGILGIKADVVAESTAAAGVTIDGTLIKDGVVTANLTGNASGSAGSCTGNAATATSATTATSVASLASVAHASAEQTGTGAPQDVAHNLAAFPSATWIEITSGHDGAGGQGNLAPTVTWGAPRADGTDYHITVTSGAKFFLHALK